MRSKLIFFFIIAGICAISFLNNNAYATVVTHSFAGSSSTGWQNNVYIEKFTGLTSGQTVQQVGLYVFANGTGTKTVINNYQALTSTGWDTIVNSEYFTGLATGQKITSVGLNVNAAAGNVRVKIYQDDGTPAGCGGVNCPSTLLGESGSIAVGGTGIRNFSFSTPVTIPASGNVWAAFETDSNLLDLKYSVLGGNTRFYVAHAYGSGPSPFGGATGSTVTPYMQITYSGHSAVRIKVYQDNNGTGGPSTLLGESGSQIVTVNGQQNFTVSANIPASGNVWAGFETNSSALSLFFTSPQLGMHSITHVYGSGPSPAGSPVVGDALSVWMQITYSLVPGSITYSTQGSTNNNIAAITQCYSVTVKDVFLTQEKLYNFTVQLLQTKNFTPPQDLPAGLTTCPYTFYQAYLYNSSFNVVSTFNDTVSESNTPPLFNTTSNNFSPGNLTIGNLNIAQVNPNTLPIKFSRIDVNANRTDLLVNYPNTFNLTCNLSYKFALTNQTYYNMPSSSYSGNRLQSIFNFTNPNSEIIYVKCSDVITGTNATYILTQSNFPIVQQIKNFRNGTYGTHGELGALDLITFLIIIIGMIGFNRINEAAGVIFVVIVTGVSAYFGIIQWPTIVGAALAVVVLISITSHKKLFGV